MPRPPRPRTTKAEAVGLAAIVGQNEAARRLNLPLSSVNRWWLDEQYGMYRDAKSEDIASAFQVGMLTGLARIIALIPNETDLGKLNAAVGTAWDKLALMRGEVTSRTEHRDIADEPDRNLALDAAETAYIRVLATPAVVGGSNGTRAASNGHSTVHPLRVPGAAADGYVEAPTHPEGPTNGHQSNGRDRGEVAS